jgi:hypothetical protein
VYTRLTPGYAWPSVGVPLFGQAPDPKVTAILDRTPYGPVAALARQLAAGASTQLDVVARVERYLRDGGRFRYTTNLPEPGLSPLADFLLRDHAGDCQHFAGAAALLLRLAGVPTRVVAGFATGEPQPDGRFEVRDVDAHAWIEVYFQGYGWVPFNPTPAAAQARVRRELDPLAPTPATGGPSGRGDAGYLADGAILGVVAAAGAAAIAGARRRRNLAQLGQLLESLVRRAGGRVQASSTLGELSVELARLVGPRTPRSQPMPSASDSLPTPSHPPRTRGSRLPERSRAIWGRFAPCARSQRAVPSGSARCGEASCRGSGQRARRLMAVAVVHESLGDGGRTAGHLQAVEDVLQVGTNGALGDLQASRDLVVRAALCDQSQQLPLPQVSVGACRRCRHCRKRAYRWGRSSVSNARSRSEKSRPGPRHNTRRSVLPGRLGRHSIISRSEPFGRRTSAHIPVLCSS